ncbi:MAG TPA: fibronectin type III-like domain-contianing protein, partial [Longimicrobiales bacterium]
RPTTPEAQAHVTYSEGVFVGYRGYDKSGVKPLFPFGFGLSYTTFSYGNLKVTPATSPGGIPVTVTFDVTNTGQRPGAEVAEIYVADGHARVARPAKELKGFARVELKPGETRTLTVSLDRRAFAYWDVKKKDWAVAPGAFTILVGGSSDNLPLKAAVNVK